DGIQNFISFPRSEKKRSSSLLQVTLQPRHEGNAQEPPSANQKSAAINRHEKPSIGLHTEEGRRADRIAAPLRDHIIATTVARSGWLAGRVTPSLDVGLV